MTKYITSKSLARQRRLIQQLESKLQEKGKELGEAGSQGAESWHDNAPFEAARDEVMLQDKALSRAHEVIAGTQIRDYLRNVGDFVDYGVGVRFLRDGKLVDLKIVGYGDSDVEEGRVLYESPIAKVLIGKKVGDEFEAEVAGRPAEIKVKEVYVISED
ncbi:hypothetical protein CMI47_04930 [Candidatus Pacearchaeota archaeon]|nr:hypothetical protein [Candidatus Pacearchaeota archaeon]|tara:strand:- start:1682 stop:2158 length:477 start_codon:yes stop_codon:yes gene_type:complete